MRIGTINSNVFQDNDYMLGSVTNPDARIRRKATDHLLECVDIMDATGSRDLKLWFADGTNYPGQDDIVARQDRLAAALAEVYDRLGDDQRILLEYKLFEPSFYTMDVPDWGTAYAHCIALGPKAQVVIDTGHHAPGTNIEFIVAMLLRAGKLGGFDFNSRFYADDDLMVGAADPFQLFRIMWEVRRGGGLDPATGVAFMLDQCHNIEPKIAAQIRSVMNVQEATAKALLVDAEALAAAQAAGDVLGANAVFMDAYATDVRPLLAEISGRAGLDPDPVAAYHRSGLLRRGLRRAGRRRPGGLGGMTATAMTADRGDGRRRARSGARTGSAPTRATPTTPAATPRPRATSIDPVTDRPVELLWVKGSRRRPRHADAGRARRAAARPACAPSSTSTRASTARTRWSPPSTTACTDRAARRRRSTPRCTASSSAATSTTSTPTPASPSPPQPTARR